MQAKTLFGSAAALLVAGTAFVTWQVKGELDSKQVAALEATIKTKESFIEFQQAKIAELSDKKGAPDTIAGVSRIEVLPIKARFDLSPPGFDVAFRNSGSAAASRPLKIWRSLISDRELNEAEISAIYDELYRDAEGYSVPPAANEMWPGKQSWLTMPVNRGSGTADDVQNGKSFMYLFMLVVYTDADAPAGNVKFTEGCFFTFKNQAIHECGQHNRLLLGGRR